MLTPATNYDFYRSSHEEQNSVRRTYEWTVPALKRLGAFEGCSVLSVGCGSGIDILTLRCLGYEAWGTDGFPCVAKASGYFAMSDATTLPFQDESFDVVIALEVIEHVEHDHGGFAGRRNLFCLELKRLARHAILIATPNRLFPADEHGDPIRFHSPFRDSTLSYYELCDCFRGMDPQVLPWGRYFGLERFKKYVSEPGTKIVNAGLQAFNGPLLHRSPLNPHLFLGFKWPGSVDKIDGTARKLEREMTELAR